MLFYAIYCRGCLQFSRCASNAKFGRVRSKFMIYKVGYVHNIFLGDQKPALYIVDYRTNFITKLEKDISKM